MKLQIYSKADCPFCVTAKNALDQLNIQYEELEFGRNADLNEFKEKYPNVKSVPAFFIDGVYVGGSGKLQSVITIMRETHD